jgi:hypothetical protein
MAKYYVQSGSLRGIVDCFDEQCAAVWAIQRISEKASLRALDSAKPVEQTIHDCMSDAMFELDDVIHVSEQGHDRSDSLAIDLHDAFLHWYQLRKAIDSLSKAIDERFGE